MTIFLCAPFCFQKTFVDRLFPLQNCRSPLNSSAPLKVLSDRSRTSCSCKHFTSAWQIILLVCYFMLTLVSCMENLVLFLKRKLHMPRKQYWCDRRAISRAFNFKLECRFRLHPSWVAFATHVRRPLWYENWLSFIGFIGISGEYKDFQWKISILVVKIMLTSIFVGPPYSVQKTANQLSHWLTGVTSCYFPAVYLNSIYFWAKI